MTLPKQFRFSQASLQDFQDCRRRFQLRYLEKLSWPAVETEPALEHEEQMKLGAQFHRLVHQHQLGIDAGLLQASIRNADLLRWWENYLDNPIPGLPSQRLPEHVLSVPLGEYRLIAKLDLIAYQPGERLVVVDWKTSRKAPGRQQLSDRLQTLVYRYVAVEAGAHINGGQPFEPEQVSFVYWFANEPDSPIIFDYSAQEHAAAREKLLHQASTIAALEVADFFLTENEQHCRFCGYRSLCGRGVTAGDLSELEFPEADSLEDFDLDLEQVGEIAF